MKTTFNQNFVLRKTNLKQPALATVYLRMTVEGCRTEFSLQRQCDPEKWMPEKGRLNGKTEDVKSFNSYLQRVESKIYETFQDFISSGIEFNGERIKVRYLGFDVEEPKMCGITQEELMEINEEIESLMLLTLDIRQKSAMTFSLSRTYENEQSRRKEKIHGLKGKNSCKEFGR